MVTKVNSQCDGDQDSYDVMVLLTGRYDYQDLKGATPGVGGIKKCKELNF